jgi:hypothetical protein
LLVRLSLRGIPSCIQPSSVARLASRPSVNTHRSISKVNYAPDLRAKKPNRFGVPALVLAGRSLKAWSYKLVLG